MLLTRADVRRRGLSRRPWDPPKRETDESDETEVVEDRKAEGDGGSSSALPFPKSDP